MANTVSAKKRVRRDLRASDVNRNRRSRVRTFLKKAEMQIDSGNKKAAQEALRKADSEAQRGVRKGVFHAKAISRKISRLSKKVAGLK